MAFGLATVTYIVYLAQGQIEIQADMVREVSYFTHLEGQQPSIVFYRGRSPTRDNVVAQFVLKNIGGYAVAANVKAIEESV